MSKLLLISFLLMLPFKLFSQIQIGDIEIESLEALFDENNRKFWDEFGVFSKAESEIWMTELPSMMINVESDKSIALVFQKDLNQDSLRTFIINQLSEQFGDFKLKELPMPSLPSLVTYEWRKEENNIEYFFSLNKDDETGILTIFSK